MGDRDQRIEAILGVERERTDANVRRYMARLKETMPLPLRVTGRDFFPWEEPFVMGTRGQDEYERMKRDKPSYTDQFDLIGLEGVEHEDIRAKIRRVSDKREFTIGLSMLECVDPRDAAYVLLEDYATWHACY